MDILTWFGLHLVSGPCGLQPIQWPGTRPGTTECPDCARRCKVWPFSRVIIEDDNNRDRFLSQADVLAIYVWLQQFGMLLCMFRMSGWIQRSLFCGFILVSYIILWTSQGPSLRPLRSNPSTNAHLMHWFARWRSLSVPHQFHPLDPGQHPVIRERPLAVSRTHACIYIYIYIYCTFTCVQTYICIYMYVYIIPLY